MKAMELSNSSRYCIYQENSSYINIYNIFLKCMAMVLEYQFVSCVLCITFSSFFHKVVLYFFSYGLTQGCTIYANN